MAKGEMLDQLWENNNRCNDNARWKSAFIVKDSDAIVGDQPIFLFLTSILLY